LGNKSNWPVHNNNIGLSQVRSVTNGMEKTTQTEPIEPVETTWMTRLLDWNWTIAQYLLQVAGFIQFEPYLPTHKLLYLNIIY